MMPSSDEPTRVLAMIHTTTHKIGLRCKSNHPTAVGSRLPQSRRQPEGAQNEPLAHRDGIIFAAKNWPESFLFDPYLQQLLYPPISSPFWCFPVHDEP